MGKEVRGLRNTNSWLQYSHGDIKYSIGNGVAKELIHMIYEHELQWEDCLRDCPSPSGNHPGGWGQTGKNQDNCNSIINEI